MNWRSTALMLGAIVVGLVGWQLNPYVQNLSVTQMTETGPPIVTTGWGILRAPGLWPLLVVGLLIGWFLGRLEGLWTGARAAQADWQSDRDREDEAASQSGPIARDDFPAY